MNTGDIGAPEQAPSQSRSRSAVIAAVIVLVLAVVAAVILLPRVLGPSGGRNDGGPTTAPTPGATQDVVHDQLVFDEVERFFRVYVPPSVTPDSTVPLLIALHGNGTDEEGFARSSGLDEKAAAEGFVVVYPRAVDGVWNGGFSQKTRNVDDVGFLVALVDQLAADYPIDTEQVFATGLSGGGIMTYRLACDAPDLVAAIAPVAATMAVECNPTAPVSVLHIHGTADPTIPIEGRADRGAPAAAAVVEAWSGFDGCDAEPQVAVEDASTITTWSGCESGTEVTFYSVDGMRHEYPWRGEDDALDVRDVSWSFFTEHARALGTQRSRQRGARYRRDRSRRLDDAASSPELRQARPRTQNSLPSGSASTRHATSP